METFSTDTLLSSSQRLQGGSWSFLRPSLTHGPLAGPWHTARDPSDPPFIASCSEPDYAHHITFARNHALRSGPTRLLYADFDQVYLSPPSSSSASKSTIPLPEEASEFPLLYSTHLAGVLDSPPVMRRADLASQKPLTPPPTIPHQTLNLPDADVDALSDDQDVELTEGVCESDEFFTSPSESSSPHSVGFDFPLSPLSPSWDSRCARALTIATSPDFRALEHFNGLFSPCDATAPHALDYCDPPPISPRKPSSLLEVDVDAPRPLLAPINIPWASSPSTESDPEPPSSSSSSSSLTSLIDYDELPSPSSPLISRLDLPDLEGDGLPKIVPSSPSRRSFSSLPDADIEMGDSTSDSVTPLPSQQLLSLPGVETDDDLIPSITAPTHSIPYTPTQPLLFIDDPRDVPLPRSPSPEDFDLFLSPEDITDPELAKLFDLRKRSMAAERAARRLEALTEDVDLFTRAEARKIRKRERERSKEVGALIRLKLGDRVEMSPQEQSPECDLQNYARRRGLIGSVSQLVAQMVFRRNETYRPLAKRKVANTSREYVRSALSDGTTQCI